MTIGIYTLNFSGTHKLYVGQSKFIERRYSEHLASFRHRTASGKLQEAYDLYGVPELKIIYECIEEELSSLENEAIVLFNSHKDGFNTFRVDSGHIRSLSGLAHPNSKYSKIIILKVFSYLYKTLIPYRKIAMKLQVNEGLVKNIANGTSHLWLRDQYPDKFNIMLSNKIKRNKCNVKSVGYYGNNLSLVDPDGIIHRNITNIAEFCRNHPILSTWSDSTRSSLGKVLKGLKPSHRGWKLYTHLN